MGTSSKKQRKRAAHDFSVERARAMQCKTTRASHTHRQTDTYTHMHDTGTQTDRHIHTHARHRCPCLAPFLSATALPCNAW